MRNYKTKEFYPCFLVDILPTGNYLDIYKLHDLFGYIIKSVPTSPDIQNNVTIVKAICIPVITAFSNPGAINVQEIITTHFALSLKIKEIKLNELIVVTITLPTGKVVP